MRGGIINRGITESTANRWILGMPYTHDICEEIEEFCSIKFNTSDQHVDARDSRITRDYKDLQKIMLWFDSHDPFAHDESLMNIATGVVGGE